MKNLNWIVAVLALSFAGDRIASWVLGTVVQQSQFRYSRLYNEQASADVLLLGNSRGLIFFQPYIEEKTGLTTTNLSYNGLPMDLAAALAMDFIDKNGAPKLLLLDVTLLDKRMDARLISGFNLYTPYSSRLSDLLKKNYPESYYGGKVTNLYRYNSEVFQRALYYWKKSDEDWLLDRIISKTMEEQVADLPPFNHDFTDDMLDDLAGLVEYADNKGIAVQLVINPYLPAFAEKVANGEKLKKAILEKTGKTVLDFGNSITVDNGFGDYQHLNKTGAKAYIDLLIEQGVFQF